MIPNLSTPTDSRIISFMTLRKWVGLLGILLAPVLMIGSIIAKQSLQIEISLSAYYHTDMRNALVGIICGISFFLLSYNGYDRRDSLVSKLAGLFALGIAFFPTSADPNDKTDIISKVHYIVAGIFFALLSYMSIVLFTKTAGYKTKQKIQRNRIYRTCGFIMLIAIACIPLAGLSFIRPYIAFLKPTLLLEAIALLAFGFSWLVKGEFILKDKPLDVSQAIRERERMVVSTAEQNSQQT